MKKGWLSVLAVVLLFALTWLYLYRDAPPPGGARKLLRQSPHRAGLKPENPAAQLPLPPHPLGRKGTVGQAPATPADGAQAAAAWEQYLRKRLGLVEVAVVVWHNHIYIALPEQAEVAPQQVQELVRAQEPAWQQVVVLTRPELCERLKKIAAAIRQGPTAADFAAELESLTRGGSR